MIVIAIVASFTAAVWSFIVMYANGMRSSPGPFQGGGTIVAIWALVAVFWLAWWFSHARH